MGRRMRRVAGGWQEVCVCGCVWGGLGEGAYRDEQVVLGVALPLGERLVRVTVLNELELTLLGGLGGVRVRARVRVRVRVRGKARVRVRVGVRVGIGVGVGVGVGGWGLRVGLEPFLDALPLSVIGSLKTCRGSPLTTASQHLKAHLRGVRGGGERG